MVTSLCQNGIDDVTNKQLGLSGGCGSTIDINDEDGGGVENHIYIVQIGAHVGIESNDPMAKGLTNLPLSLPEAFRREYVHWIFVEPSPANYQRLSANLKDVAHLADMMALNMAIVPERQRYHQSDGNDRDSTEQE